MASGLPLKASVFGRSGREGRNPTNAVGFHFILPNLQTPDRSVERSFVHGPHIHHDTGQEDQCFTSREKQPVKVCGHKGSDGSLKGTVSCQAGKVRYKPALDDDPCVVSDERRNDHPGARRPALLYSLRLTYNAIEVVYGGVWYGTGQQPVSLLR